MRPDYEGGAETQGDADELNRFRQELSKRHALASERIAEIEAELERQRVLHAATAAALSTLERGPDR